MAKPATSRDMFWKQHCPHITYPPPKDVLLKCTDVSVQRLLCRFMAQKPTSLAKAKAQTFKVPLSAVRNYDKLCTALTVSDLGNHVLPSQASRKDNNSTVKLQARKASDSGV